MNKEQAINYLQSSGFSEEQIKAIEVAFSGWGTCIPASEKSEGSDYEMTREKAIAFFKGIYGNLEEVEMAIKALQPMPSISDDGTLMVNIEDGTKVGRVLVWSDNHFGGLYYPEQEPKMGHWISHMKHCEMNNLRPSGLGSYFWCSECGCGVENKSFSRVNYNYCPECGAKMS